MMRPLLEEYYGSAGMAKAVFSDYTTGAVTLFNMPAVLVYPIASAIVPYMTAARARGDHAEVDGYISSALRIAALVSLPASLGMSILARPILSVVFLGDADMAANAGAPLALLAISIFPLALLAVTNAILQALGKQGRPILSMCAGVAVKLTVLTLATPALGPLAAPLGTLCFYLVALLFNLYFVFRYTAFGASLFRVFIPPTLSAVLSSLAAFATFLLCGFLGEVIALGCGIALAVLVYLLSILFLGAVDASDLALFPHTERLRALLLKYHIIRSEG
jgi:stage V sporulation protein B